MWHFDGENKSGFTKLTRSVYLAYIRSIPAKIYCIDVEVFAWFYRVKKASVYFMAKFATPESYGPISGVTGRLCASAGASDPRLGWGSRSLKRLLVGLRYILAPEWGRMETQSPSILVSSQACLVESSKAISWSSDLRLKTSDLRLTRHLMVDITLVRS